MALLSTTPIQQAAVNLSWLDRVVNFVSPRVGLKRILHRAAIQRLSYEGARTGRRADGWVTAGTSAAAEVAPALNMLRSRSHDLIRNSPYAQKALAEFTGTVIGTGIIAKADTGNPSLNAKIDEAWAVFEQECDADGQLNFDGLMALVVRTEFESGETLCRFRPRRTGDGLHVPLQIQVMEPDWIDSSKTLGQRTGSYIVLGIQFNLLGKREGYWMYNAHPGEIINTSLRGHMESRLVPASEVLHVYRKDRPGLPRGVPRLHPVMTTLRDLADYEDAELVRKKIEACSVGVVEQQEDANPSLGTEVSEESGSGVRLEGFRPGMFHYLKNGERVTFNNPQHSPGYRDYKVAKLQEIATGLHMPYFLLSSDLSEATYSSSRIGLHGWQTMIEAYRWHILIPSVCQPVWNRFIQVATTAGVLPIPIGDDGAIERQYYRCKWVPNKFISADPVKDAVANLTRMRSGEILIDEVIAATGNDPEEQLAKIAARQKWLRDNGVVLDSDPSQVTGAGAFQPAIEQQPPVR